MGIWAWIQLGDRIWKVVTDHEKGTLCVYDESGTLILQRRGLTKELLTVIETNFLKIVATKLIEEKLSEDSGADIKKSIAEYNPMYA